MVRHIYATLVVQPLSIQATGSPFHFVERKWQNQSSTIWTAPQTMLWPTFRRALCGITGVLVLRCIYRRGEVHLVSIIAVVRFKVLPPK